MKKFRVRVAEGSSDPQSFVLFSSAEALWSWLSTTNDSQDSNDIRAEALTHADEVTIVPGEFLEVEARGYEFVKNGPEFRRLDYVRLVKAAQSQNSSGLLITLHYGWTVDVPLKETTNETLNANQIADDEKQFDLTILFKDNDDS